MYDLILKFQEAKILNFYYTMIKMIIYTFSENFKYLLLFLEIQQNNK